MESFPIYFARLTFYRDSNNVKLEIRQTKKGRKIRRMVDIPESINIQELHWEKIRNKYMKGTFAIYERREGPSGLIYYTDSRRTVPHASLNQRLENLLHEFI